MGCPHHCVRIAALDLDPLDHRAVGRWRNRRDDLVGDQRDRLRRLRVVGDLDRIAEDVARRAFPVLPLPLVHVQPHRLPVRAREPGVDVDEGLHPGTRPRADSGGSRAGSRAPRHRREPARPGARAFDVLREQRDAGRRRLFDGRAAIVAADRDVHHAGHRLRSRRLRKRDQEARRVRLRARDGHVGRDAREEQRDGGCGDESSGQSHRDVW